MNAELAHPVAKGVGMEIQNLRGALWPIQHSISPLQEAARIWPSVRPV